VQVQPVGGVTVGERQRQRDQGGGRPAADHPEQAEVALVGRPAERDPPLVVRVVGETEPRSRDRRPAASASSDGGVEVVEVRCSGSISSQGRRGAGRPLAFEGLPDRGDEPVEVARPPVASSSASMAGRRGANGNGPSRTAVRRSGGDDAVDSGVWTRATSPGPSRT
jgi:hypothetical protein